MEVPELIKEDIKRDGGHPGEVAEELSWGSKKLVRVGFDTPDGFWEDNFYVMYDDGEIRKVELHLGEEL